MAKAKAGRNFFNSFFYILMSVMAMNFLIICIYLIGLQQLGYCTVDDFKDIMQVLVGNRKYVLSRDQIAEYQKLKDEKTAADKGLERSEGSGETRAASAEALRDQRRQLEERISALRELRADQEQKLTDLRASIEALKAEYVKERKNLDDWKKESTQAELSDSHQRMLKTMRAMEPETITNLFTGNMLRPGGVEENARIIRQYLTPEITSEVLGGLNEQYMRQIVPLLENKYAGMGPEAIVKAWTTPGTSDFKTPEQMALYMRNMPVTQAFTVFTLLDPKNRAEVVRYLKLPTSDDKRP